MTNPVTNPPAGGGMPTWLKIVLVLVLLMLLGCCGAFAACRFMCQAAGNAAQQYGSDMTQKMKEEAEKQGMKVDTTGAGLALPENFPKDVYVPSGFKVMSSVTPPGAKMVIVSMTGTEDPAKVMATVETEMKAKGWVQSQAVNDQEMVMRMYTKEKRTATIVASGKAGDSTVQITQTEE